MGRSAGKELNHVRISVVRGRSFFTAKLGESHVLAETVA